MRGNFGNIRISNSDDLDGCAKVFCILFFGILLIAGIVFYLTGDLK